MDSLLIRPFKITDMERLIQFADAHIGKNYFTPAEAQKIFQRSSKQGLMTSFVLCPAHQPEIILGMRISYPPGTWLDEMESQCRPNLWGVPRNQVAYFKSLFLHPSTQKQGWGPKMSKKSIEVLKKLRAKAIVCHAWKESPNNSSLRYLKKAGFKPLYEHKLFWNTNNYECILCGPKPCQCTSVEMIYNMTK